MQIGIDIGSRAIKMAVFQDGELTEKMVVESSFEPHRQAADMVSPFAPSRIVATGYGRHLAQKHFAQQVITEIKAHAQGARYCVPGCRTILDVGGQDSKVIALDANGRVVQFQMNDKCAAGTGRFLEIMSASLEYSLEGFPLLRRHLLRIFLSIACARSLPNRKWCHCAIAGMPPPISHGQSIFPLPIGKAACWSASAYRAKLCLQGVLPTISFWSTCW